MSFFKQDKKLIPAEIHNIAINIKDTRTDISQNIQVNPEWQSKGYSFFDLKPDEHEFAAEKTADNFMELVQQTDTEKADQFILPNLRPTFAWNRLEHEYLHLRYSSYPMFYENNYGGFTDVYSCNINYTPEGPRGTEAEASQKIYLINHEGQWKIIDVSQVTAAG